MLKSEDLEYFVTVLRFLLNYCVRFIFAGVVVYCFTLAITYYYDYFSWHIMLCTFGYVPLMAESIMMFAGDELWSKQMSHRTKNIVHGVLISVGTTFAIIGNVLMFYYYTPGYHLYTTHGITGLVSMILLIISLFFGLAAHFAQELTPKLKPIFHPFRVTAVTFKFCHNLFGLAAYAVGMTSLCYAFYTNWFVFYTTKESRQVALIATILATIWSGNNALKSGFNQLRAMFGF